MNAEQALSTFINIAFAIVIWFAVPIVLPVAATLGWTLIVLNALFSLCRVPLAGSVPVPVDPLQPLSQSIPCG